MQPKIYHRIMKSMIQNKGKRPDGAEEVAFFALVYWLRQVNMSTEKLKEVWESDSRDKEVCAFLKKTADECFSLIVETARNISDEELQDIIHSLPSYRGLTVAKRETPAGVAELAIQLLNLQPEDRAADLCSGFGTVALQACRHYPGTSWIAVEKDEELYIGAAILASVLHVPMTAVCGDVFDPCVLKNYPAVNKVFCHIPMGFRYRDLETQIRSYKELSELFFYEKRNITGEWAFAAAARTLCAAKGRVVLLMVGSSLSNNQDQQMRREFLRRGWIETVIALPERLIQGSVASYMVVLSDGNEKVRMVDATSFYGEEYRKHVLTSGNVKQIMECVDGDTQKSCTLSVMQLAGNQYNLDPTRYLTEVDERLRDAETLDTLCTVTRGYVAKAEAFEDLTSDEPTDYQYFRVQDMENGTIRRDLPYLKALPPSSENFCIQSGDILISKLTPFKVALAGDVGSQKILATENMYILRSRRDAIEPAYLLLYLQSELGIQELSYWAKGRQIHSLSIQNLKKVRIPSMPRKRQKEIAEQYQKLQKERIEAENRLRQILKEIQDLVQ